MAGQDGEGEKPQIIREVKEEPLEEQLREVGDVIDDADALSTLAAVTADEPALDLLPDDEGRAIGEIQTLAVEPPAAKGPAQEERGQRQRKMKKKTTTDAGVATPTAVEEAIMSSNPSVDQLVTDILDPTTGIVSSEGHWDVAALSAHVEGLNIPQPLKVQLVEKIMNRLGNRGSNLFPLLARLRGDSAIREAPAEAVEDVYYAAGGVEDESATSDVRFARLLEITPSEWESRKATSFKVFDALEKGGAIRGRLEVIEQLEALISAESQLTDTQKTEIIGRYRQLLQMDLEDSVAAASATPSGAPEGIRQPLAPAEEVPVAPPAAVDGATTAGEAPANAGTTTPEPQSSAPDAPAADAPPAPESATSASRIIMDEWNEFRDENPGSTLGDYLQSHGGLERNGMIPVLLHILNNLALDDAEISGRLWGRSMADHRDDLSAWGVDFMTANDFDTYLSEQFGVTTGTQKDTVYRAYVGAYAARKDEELRDDFAIEFNQDNGLTLGKYIVDRHINPASPPVLLNMMLRLSGLEITDVPLSPEEFRTSILRNWGMDGDNFPRDQYYAIYESVYKERQRGARPRERREDEPGSPTGRERVPGPDTPEEEDSRDEFSDALKLAQDYAKKLEAGLGISKINEAAAAWRQHSWKENIEKGVKWTIAAAAILSIILGLVLNVPWSGALLGSGVAAIAGGGVLYGKGKTFDWWRGYSVKERKRMIAEGKWTNTLIGTVKSLKENGLWDVMEPSQQQSVLRMLDGFKTQSAASAVNAQAAVS